MCGIAGVININNDDIEAKSLLQMSQVISHRGPDDEGYVLINQSNSSLLNLSGDYSIVEFKKLFSNIRYRINDIGANIGFAHRRFSIIDLSASGHQPFFDKDKKFCLIFNGEIYNYIELREELSSKGVSFCTSSDTEVLLESYKYFGSDCFSKLNGFWALALYDFEKRKLILSRDRLGKKPLYWTRENNKILFASEIKSLLEVVSKRRINQNVIYHWLTLGYRDLDFSTFFESIYSFPSGCWAEINSTFPNNIMKFWTLPKIRLSEREISVAEACKSIQLLLEDSIKIRLRSDVPLCVELSGGLDSSSLVAFASQVSKTKIITYTVKFPEKEWDEENFARSVAKYYDVDYRVIENPVENFWSQIIPFTYLEEEPYHSPNLQTNQEIWALMREDGIKVSLNGAAGDELFAGYGNYYSKVQIENLIKFRFGHYLANLNWKESDNPFNSFFNPLIEVWKEYLGLPFPSIRFKKSRFDFIKLSPTEQSRNFLTLDEILYSDVENTKIPYWLRSGDKGYMGIPLEVRAPFLDYRIVETAIKFPTSYLIKNGWHKWILRKAMEKILPADVVWRKRKMGFPFPYNTFYQNHEKIIDLIISRSDNPYIDFSKKELFKNNWRTLSFLLWYEMFINKNLGLFNDIKNFAPRSELANPSKYLPEFLKSYLSTRN